MDLEQDFIRIVRLAGQLEEVSVSPRVALRIARAYRRAIDKALCTTWDAKITDVDYVNRSLMRHAERGVRDYLAPCATT